MECSINNLKIHQITVSLILLNYKLFFMNLQITSEDGTQDVGKISKQWSGLMREYFTDADNFGVSCKYMLINMINYWIVGIFSIQKKKNLIEVAGNYLMSTLKVIYIVFNQLH